jgi:hypothetical protein
MKVKFAEYALVCSIVNIIKVAEYKGIDFFLLVKLNLFLGYFENLALRIYIIKL